MDQFIGDWRLISFEEEQPGGEITYPYGKDPVGLLVYGAGGGMSVQIMRRDRHSLSSTDPAQLAPEEIRAAIQGFTAFFGSYEVNWSDAVITHTVEGHLLPNSVGKQLKRRFEFSGNRLILRPSPTRRITWERIA